MNEPVLMLINSILEASSVTKNASTHVNRTKTTTTTTKTITKTHAQ